MPRREHLIALNAANRLHRALICRLGGSIEMWGDCPDPALEEVAGELGVPTETLAQARALIRRGGRIADREQQAAESLGARILTRFDREYPGPLRELSLPPPVLYLRGEVPERPTVAIVGPRNPDPYGREVAELFGRALAATGVVVVSGFARGVDVASHRGAIAAPQGLTLAVLGCGLGVDYPRQHAGLLETIAERGAVITEFPCGDPPLRRHFPIRNRIIAALALGTLVVQAAPRSGSLITARYALELGRDVYALPGRIFDERSLGTNALIRDGALLVQHPRDILESLPIAASAQLTPGDPPAGSAVPPLPGPSGALLRTLQPGQPLAAEEIAHLVGASVNEILSLLLELELAGWIRRHPGPVFTRAL